MKYAVFSDIHANLQAWNAVFTDLRGMGVDELVCLGDVVGYGPDPGAILEHVHRHVHHFVLGNHDAVIAGVTDGSNFNGAARQAIEWTRLQLDAKARQFFGGMPFVLESEVFVCAHGDPVDPARFAYILDPEDATRVWDGCEQQMVFVGHSHVPGFFIRGQSGTPHWLDPQNFQLEEGKRYIVNVGSVGQPRNGDFRSSYCVYDDDTQSVYFRQVPFDLDAYRQAAKASGLPVLVAPFLDVSEASELPPLREQLDFSPLSHEQASEVDVTVAQLDSAVRSVRRWRVGAAALLALLVAALGVSLLLWQRSGPGYTEFPAQTGSVLEATVGEMCMKEPRVVGMVGADSTLSAWTVQIADLDTQSVSTETWKSERGQSAPVFRLRSQTPGHLALVSAPVQAVEGSRFQCCASVRLVSPVQGHIEMCLIQTLSDGTEELIVHYPLEKLSDSRWKACRKSGDARGLRREGMVRLVIKGQFTGELLLRACNLKRLQ
ncbi:MAG: metallophosphoesterase family protein [Lentisphaeria bacterium]|nr:metallophosphoesterase family protein [Lentisphaeria bacterium]